MTEACDFVAVLARAANKSAEYIIVSDYEEGVCVDPGERETILGTGGPGPPGKGEEGQQLLPDSGGGET
jgi:hypothetical protein